MCQCFARGPSFDGLLARGPSFDGLLAPSAPCPPTPSASAAAHRIRRRENSLSCLYSQHSHALGQTLAATPLQRPPPPPTLRPSLGHAVRRGEVSLHVPFAPSSSSRALIWFRDEVVELVRCCGSGLRRRTVALRVCVCRAPRRPRDLSVRRVRSSQEPGFTFFPPQSCVCLVASSSQESWD
jgi:hypothetical protein